jgi:hypothetical protein
MIVAISAHIIKLLNGQRALLDDTIRESQVQTMALHGNRVDQTLLTALRPHRWQMVIFPIMKLPIISIKAMSIPLSDD